MGWKTANPSPTLSPRTLRLPKSTYSGNIHQIVAATTITEEEALARDLFLFSFYTRGMSFVDIAFLEKEALRTGSSYTRGRNG